MSRGNPRPVRRPHSLTARLRRPESRDVADSAPAAAVEFASHLKLFTFGISSYTTLWPPWRNIPEAWKPEILELQGSQLFYR